MKVAVTGSRSIDDSLVVHDILTEWAKENAPGERLTVMSGGARGVDDWAERWAMANGHDYVLFKPYFLVDNRAAYNPRHYMMRNKQLVSNADHVVAIWDGESSGTKFTVSYARKKRVPLSLYQP